MWIERKTTGPSKFFDLEETAAYAACDSVGIQGEMKCQQAVAWISLISDMKFFLTSKISNFSWQIPSWELTYPFFSVWHFWVDNVPVLPQLFRHSRSGIGSELRVQSREEDERLFDSRKMFKYQQRAWLKPKTMLWMIWMGRIITSQILVNCMGFLSPDKNQAKAGNGCSHAARYQYTWCEKALC